MDVDRHEAEPIYDPDRGIMDGVPESALIGAILGGGTGSIGATRRPVGQEDSPDAEFNDIENPEGSGSAPGLAPAGQADTPPGGPVGASDATGLDPNDIPVAPETSGPLGRVEEVAVTERAPVEAETAPTQRFPDMKSGKDVVLTDPSDGRQIDAVFLGETETGVMVRVSGDEFEISSQEFDQAISATKAAKRAPKVDPKSEPLDTTTAPETKPETAPYTEVDPELERGEPKGLAAEALQNVLPPKPVQNDTIPQTGAQAMEMASFIEEQARSSGWNARLRARYNGLIDDAARLNKEGADGVSETQTKRNGHQHDNQYRYKPN